MQLLNTLVRTLTENKARLAQLASRYIGSGLIALAGTLGVFQGDEGLAQLENAAQVIGMLIVGLLLLGLDLLIHKVDRGGLVVDKPTKAKKLTQEKS